jgi:hypothetical protein
MTDQDLVSIVQSDLIETPDGGQTASTPLWDPSEYWTTLTDAERMLLGLTGLRIGVATLGTLAGQAVYLLPAGCAQVLRAAWVDAAGGISDLSPVDTWELDCGIAQWGMERDRPAFYHVGLLPAQQIRLIRAPLDAGSIHLLYVDEGTASTGSGATLATPEDWVDYLRWGMHARLLEKTGPAYDPGRAAYASARMLEGILLARLVLDSLTGGLGPEDLA